MNVIVILKDRVLAPVTAAQIAWLQRLDQQSFQPDVCLGQNACKCLRVSGFSIFDNILFKIHNKMFRVGTITHV